MYTVRSATFGALIAAALAGSTMVLGQQAENPDGLRPKIALRATPAVGLTPARIVLSAELVGGADDFEDYYCASIEWDWDDDTKSESTSDCEPYESGVSEIRRRYSVEHVFKRAGAYRISFRLKQRDKQVGAASVTVNVRPRPGEY